MFSNGWALVEHGGVLYDVLVRSFCTSSKSIQSCGHQKDTCYVEFWNTFLSSIYITKQTLLNLHIVELLYLQRICVRILVFYFLFWDKRSTEPTPNELKRTKKTRPLRGEAGPFGGDTPPRKKNHNPTHPRTTPKPPRQLPQKVGEPTYVVVSNSTQYVSRSSYKGCS